MKAKRHLLTLSAIALLISCTQKPTDTANAAVYEIKSPAVFTRKPIVVAVIDTGIHESLMTSRFLCRMGHKDFTGTGINDRHGHGSHISGLIDQYVKNRFVSKDKPADIADIKSDYCQVILKYYDPKAQNQDNLKNELKALRHAINIKVDYINFSGGGTDRSEEELKLIKEALSKGIKIIVAAGNEKSNLAEHPYYPAMLDSRLYVVGNLVKDNVRAPTSNYGDAVNVWEYGTNVMSYCSKSQSCPMTGTSQATAIKTGKLIREALSQKF